MNRKILLSSQDPATTEQLSVALPKIGCEVIIATSTDEALKNLFHQTPDLTIIDTEGGWELCHHLQGFPHVPLILLISSGREEDKLKGLRLGADDFLVKPFSLRELCLRVQAQLRRLSPDYLELKGPFYSNGYLWASFYSSQVRLGGRPVHLTPKEHCLLLYLIRHAGKVLSPQELLSVVWGEEESASESTLKQYIWRLRQKLEKDPNHPRLIMSSYRKGYFFQEGGEGDENTRDFAGEAQG